MLRVVIQVSMLLSVFLMFAWLFYAPKYAGYYVGYVITFNLLVGPVFSSGSITQERERKTIGLLLTTLLTPGKILFAKLLAAMRVSTVLTFLLTEQILLAYILIPELRERLWTFPIFLLIIAVTCATTSTIGILCSSAVRRTSVAMVLTYLVLLLIYVGPIGAYSFLLAFFPDLDQQSLRTIMIISPYAAAVDVPLNIDYGLNTAQARESFQGVNLPGVGLPTWAMYLLIYPLLFPAFCGLAYVVFRYRWWKAGHVV